MIQTKKEELDKEQAAIAEYYPSLWRSLWRQCIAQGFTPKQSMELVKTFIMAQCSNGNG